MPLFLNRLPCGGIGVAGDGKDTAVRPDLAMPGQKIYAGKEEADTDEAVATAGSAGTKAPKAIRLNASAPAGIRATTIFVAGLRLPYTATAEATKKPFQTLDQLAAAGAGSISMPAIDSPLAPYPFIDESVYGLPGELKNTPNAAGGYGVRGSSEVDSGNVPLPDEQKLTLDDVNTVIRSAVKTSLKVRAAIRQPIGVPAVVHICIVDRSGFVLGAFREEDGTNFSFDVAIQKARTAAFFSDDTHAFTSTAVGFLSQKYFPPGQTNGATTGPLFHLQNALSTAANLGHGPLANGITIFPGGAPLYKNGILVGAVGISGDGVNQDDEITQGGTKGFEAAPKIRSDNLGREEVSTYLQSVVKDIYAQYTLTMLSVKGETFDVQVARSIGHDFTRLPYIKLARNPDR